ncbi:serine/threonine-protein kinase [Shewanella chilikensis]|uniref:serine/threonine-protein kinase n=1 Tax=Shewanella chilikensis TaxID=558541 RepID=UPI003B66F69B
MNAERYSFIRPIGQGGFGAVSLYSDNFLDRPVAIKRIKPIDGYDIANEFRLMSQVDSQHVATIYDVSYEGDDLIIIEEFLSGRSLSDVAGKLSYNEFLKIAYQITKGLTDIHNVNVCHRDIKPENMRFDDEGILKIYDFGISVAGENYETFNGRSTLNYAAPEIFALANGASSVLITQEYDIYSLGVSLWYLASGELANFNDFPSIVSRYGYRPSPDYKLIYNEIPDFINVLLSRTVSKRKEDRPNARNLSSVLVKELTKDKHRAKFITQNMTWTLSSERTEARNIGYTDCNFSVRYDGYNFLVESQVGNILFNNISLPDGSVIPEACVITLNRGQLGRVFVSFLMSCPEVLL